MCVFLNPYAKNHVSEVEVRKISEICFLIMIQVSFDLTYHAKSGQAGYILASHQDLHYFHSTCKYIIITGNLQGYWSKIGKECSP